MPSSFSLAMSAAAVDKPWGHRIWRPRSGPDPPGIRQARRPHSRRECIIAQVGGLPHETDANKADAEFFSFHSWWDADNRLNVMLC